MAYRFILLVLPTLALANIYVEVSGKYSGNAKDLTVYYSGEDVSVISDVERATFNLTESNLMKAILAEFGKRPDNVFVCSPTPWGDLYKKHGWQQVTRTLVPKKGNILRVASQPTLVDIQTFENNSTKPTKYNVGITQSISNTLSSSWSTGSKLSVVQKISYGIDVSLIHLTGETSFHYNSYYGTNTQQTQTVTVGASSRMDITLQPGEAVVARLEATREFVQVELVYQASLSGYVAVNFNEAYDGHHFWANDVNTCMKNIGLTKLKRSREVINIGFYSDSKVIVSDKQRGDILMDVSF